MNDILYQMMQNQAKSLPNKRATNGELMTKFIFNKFLILMVSLK